MARAPEYALKNRKDALIVCAYFIKLCQKIPSKVEIWKNISTQYGYHFTGKKEWILMVNMINSGNEENT